MNEKLYKIKENFEKSNKYILYCDHNDIEFLLETIEKQQKELEYYHKLYKDIVKDLKRMKKQDPYNEYVDFCMIFFDKFLK